MTTKKWCVAMALMALTAGCDGMPGDGEEVLEPSAGKSDTTAPAAGNGATGANQALKDVSTRVTLRLYKNGKTEVVRTLEQPGIAKVSSALTGDHVYEVRANGQTLAIESFSASFERHSMVGGHEPGFKALDEHVGLEEESVIVQVKVPGRSLADTDYDVVLHRLAGSVPHELTQIDTQSLKDLTRSGVFRPLATLASSSLRAHLAAGVRIPENAYLMAR